MTPKDSTAPDVREALADEVKRLAGEYAEHYRRTFRHIGSSVLPWVTLTDAIDRLAAMGSQPAAPAQPEGQERTGWPPGALQDDSRELSQWLASKPDTRLHAREAAQEAQPVAAQQGGDEAVGALVYEGNTVSYIKQKMRAYGNAIDAAWQVMAEAGHPADGRTPLAEAIRLAISGGLARQPLTDERIDSMAREAARPHARGWWMRFARAIEAAHGICSIPGAETPSRPHNQLTTK